MSPRERYGWSDVVTLVGVLTLPTVAGAVTSETSWQDFAVEPQQGQFVVELTIVPTESGAEAVVGLSNESPIAGVDRLAFNVILTAGGNFQATDGEVHGITAVPYAVDTAHHVRLEVNLVDDVYDAYVTPFGQNTETLASANAFRAAFDGVDELDTWALKHFQPGIEVTDFCVHDAASTCDGGPRDDGGEDEGGYHVESASCAAATPLMPFCIAVVMARRIRHRRQS